jgi:hypothetical protein
MRAAVDRRLMLRNHERTLGKVEHLALLDPIADFGSSGEPQWQQALASCRTI